MQVALPSARSRNRREEAAWAASPHRAMRVSGPMPNAASGLQLKPSTLTIQRTALLPQAAAGPRTKKSSAAFMQSQGPAKTARRQQLVDAGVAPQLSTSAAGLPGGLPGGHMAAGRAAWALLSVAPLYTRPSSARSKSPKENTADNGRSRRAVTLTRTRTRTRTRTLTLTLTLP